MSVSLSLLLIVVLLLLVAMTHAPLSSQPSRELAIFAALALGPMLLGHTGLNWALKHSPAYVVNLTLLGEPIGASLIAATLLKFFVPASTRRSMTCGSSGNGFTVPTLTT